MYQKGLAKANKDGIIPHWFLYGEKALIEELKILNSRTNQFLPDSREIAQNQICLSKIVYIGLRDSYSHKGGGTPGVGSAGLGFRDSAAFLR